MRPRAERQSGDDAAGNASCEVASRRRWRGALDQQEGRHEHHAEHVGEREARLEPVERRQRHDERGAERDRPIILPPIEKIEHRSDGSARQARNERERSRMIGDGEMGELPRSDIERVARRMRPVPHHVEVVERKSEVDRVPVVEPMRPRQREERGETGEQQQRGQRI
jgi:hypothetical protein